ncbi:MAG: DUF3078 domain-containing protein, partial [Flavobacteriia bacterium]|nr:DUF3078 domain-containing protein [Flavobacteriia bacterium]
KKLLLSLLIVPFTVSAQEAGSTNSSKWSYAGLYSLSVSQSSLTNWNAGGENNVNVSALLRQAADYNGDLWQWNNTLDANYAINYQGSSALKTGDKLELTSRLDRNMNESGTWTASAFLNFRTQFADGFKDREATEPISRWMAPGYLTAGLGFTHKKDGLEVYLSPVTMKQTYVFDDTLSSRGEFGVDPGQNIRTEMGAYLNATYTKALTESLDLTTNLNLFSNYLEEPQNVDVNWETILLLQAWSAVKVSLHLHLIYDHDINVQNPDAAGNFTSPGVQFKQVLGVGIGYTFGKYKE